MPIAELGYRPWQGARTGALRRALAIARCEVAIALLSSKLLRRFLVIAWVPILYFCPFFLAIGYVANPENDLDGGGVLSAIATEFLPRAAIAQMRADPQQFLPGLWTLAFYFFFTYTQSFLAMIAVAIVGPPLIAKDLRSKAFLVYFSKPIRPWQYLLGKFSTVAFFVFSLTLFPALVLYVVGVALSPDLSTMLATFPMVLRIVAASLMIAIPVSLLVLLLSSLTKDRRIATFAWLAVWIFGEMGFRVLTVHVGSSSGFKPPPWAGLLSLRELTTRTTAGIFDVPAQLATLLQRLGESGGRLERDLRRLGRDMGDSNLLERPPGEDLVALVVADGYPPSVSLAVLVAVSVGCVCFLLRRVTRPVRI